MGAPERKRYVVNIAGVDHTLLLTAESAKRYGDRAKLSEKASSPANKSRTPENKSGSGKAN